MIRIKDLHIQSGSFFLKSISLSLDKGQYGILMGRTGCGKTTLLEALCGLRTIQAGHIYFGDREVTQLKPAQRGIGYVPQDSALFMTMTVAENLAFALRVRRWKREAVTARVEELADLLGISHLVGRKPAGLSGGERQRVALGRALAAHPPILCLDEPLSALDQETRIEMCGLLARIKDQLKVTVLHVTHDRNEAERLADVMFRLEEGRMRGVSSHA